jgi:hypothetical protein
MLKLSDDEMAAVMRAAQPLDPDRRGDFLEAVASSLAGQVEVGEGAVYRICAEQQRRFFSPPLEVAEGGRRVSRGKYARG